ncbi:MAG: hypothetical protein JJU27_01430 [Gammaproteobacteria bacterium]|nr:hypothetical protein [Gammaproteobacteria bacterium]
MPGMSLVHLTAALVPARRFVGVVLASLLLSGGVAQAGIVALDVAQERRLELPWGNVVEVQGVARFALDPADPANAAIVDLAYAPVDDDGRVHFDADFVLQIPEVLPPSPVLLLEVSNRGSRGVIGSFNLAGRGPHETLEAEFGDGFLQRQGLVLGWLGWQFDVPREPGRMALTAPVAQADAAPIRGRLRMDWVVDRPSARLPLGHRGMRAHRVYEPDSARHLLTRRSGRDAPAELVDRARWRFVGEADPAEPDTIEMDGGFETGWIYELVWEAVDPPVAGVGLAALRDFVSHLRHDPSAAVQVEHAIAVGVSQSGRLLRQFLYDGFNLDGQGRTVFDGMFAVVAGAGRGSFNHRFAQPSLDGHRYSAFHHPVDLYPFTSLPVEDPVAGRREGLLDAYGQGPGRARLMQVNAGYEYYGRVASLLHHDPMGGQDVDPAIDERLYHMAGGQHWVQPLESLSPVESLADDQPMMLRGNAVDWRLNLRALLHRLVLWVRDDEAPPATQVPRIDTAGLVPVDELRLPAIPGLVAPRATHVARRMDYGPRFQDHGIIDHEPPHVGLAFASRVPQLDALGNECCGVRNVELRVPLATHLPWSLRHGLANPGEIADFSGTTLPLAATPALRAEQDLRPAISELYADRGDFLRQVGEAADALIDAGFLLDEDRARVLTVAGEQWHAWFVAPQEGADGNE